MISAEDLPELRELVLVTVREITPHGVYVTLDEYAGAKGYLHRSEISTGWVRHVERHVRVGQKIVLKTTRVSESRREVDLSLRQVTQDERRRKIIDSKQTDKAKTLLEDVAKKLNLQSGEAISLSDKLEDEFGSAYIAFENLAKKGAIILEKLNLQEEVLEALEQIAKERITIAAVSVKGLLEVSCNTANGVEDIKKILKEAENVKNESVEINITYLAAPKYLVTVSAEDYKTAEKALQAAVEVVKRSIGKKDGAFSFSRTHGRK